MTTARRANSEIRERRGRVNTKKIRSLTEANIARFAREDNRDGGARCAALRPTAY